MYIVFICICMIYIYIYTCISLSLHIYIHMFSVLANTRVSYKRGSVEQNNKSRLLAQPRQAKLFGKKDVSFSKRFVLDNIRQYFSLNICTEQQ